ncbi:hypothetical protein DFS33DRAFT_109700 [Desarmillaria ectypa]|nr:hypothetical protein DFS33DRAFT_109700 [Desarmillaria ectypa]
MLRTVRIYDHDPANKYDRQKFPSLMLHLSVIPTVIVQTPLSYDPVDAELCRALIEILLNEKFFTSRYDHALSVFRLIKTYANPTPSHWSISPISMLLYRDVKPDLAGLHIELTDLLRWNRRYRRRSLCRCLKRSIGLCWISSVCNWLTTPVTCLG